MFLEPGFRRWGERPEDPGAAQLKRAIALVGLLCVGFLAAAFFYMIIARRPTLNDVIGIDVWSMVLVGGVCYLYAACRDFKRHWLARKRMRAPSSHRHG